MFVTEIPASGVRIEIAPSYPPKSSIVRIITKPKGTMDSSALGYSNLRKALLDHVDDEDKGVTKCDTLDGTQEMTIINGSGLYSLTVGYKRPNDALITVVR